MCSFWSKTHFIAAILVLFFAIPLPSLAQTAQPTTTGNTEDVNEIITDMESRAKGNISSDPTSYSIDGSQLLSGPGPDDVAANMALMAFGHPIKKIMDDRFNGINASSDDSDKTLITHMATITTSLALFFTSLMLVAALVGGVIYTGKDGELLGKDWDHKLFPLRASWHTALLIPLPGFGGLCGIQVFILFLGLIGLGIGGITFTSGVNFLSNGNQIVTYQDRDINALSEKVMHAAMCDSIVSRMLDTEYYQPGFNSKVLEKRVNIRGTSNPGWRDMIVGREFFIGDEGKCGSYKINYLPPTDAQMDSALKEAREEFNVDNTHADIIKTALFEHLVTGTPNAIENYFNQVKLIIDAEDGIVDRFIDDVPLENGSQREFKESEVEDLESLRGGFYTAVKSSFTPSLNNDIKSKFETLNASFVEEVSRFGFAFFFKYYYELSSRQEVTSGAVHSFINADESFEVPWSASFCQGYWNSIKSFFSADGCANQQKAELIQKRVQRGFYDMYRDTNILYSNALGAMTDSKTFSGSLIENLTFNAAQELTQIPRDINPDPIVEVKWLGDTLTGVAEVIFVLTARVKAAADGAAAASTLNPLAAGVFGAIKSMLSSIVGKLWVGLMPLFGLAFAYAYIIPSIPVIFGFVAVFSFFIYWALALFHSPFWYAMGVMPKGDGLMGRANTGYSMAVNLLLMPAFMIIGFFTGMALMKVFGWYVSISFFDAMADVNRPGGINDFSLSKIVGLFVVYGTVYTILIWKCFGMIFETSNTLSQWMGTNNRTDFGEQEAKTTALSASGVVGQKFGESAVKMDQHDKKQAANDKRDSRESAASGSGGAGGGEAGISKATDQLQSQLKGKN